MTLKAERDPRCWQKLRREVCYWVFYMGRNEKEISR